MPLRTKDEYLSSLRDGRTVFFKGEQVKDVTAHPYLSRVVEHVALEYEISEDARYRDQVTFIGDDGERYSRYFKTPRSSQDLLDRSRIVRLGTTLGGSVVLLIKEIGTDCLFALDLISRRMDQQLGTDYRKRVEAYHRYCMTSDLAMAVAQTDVKGDRSLPPSEQLHPDYYVHVVEERDDGIVVRGAKAHTSYAPIVNEVMVIPTRNLTEKDKDYAVAFAVPADTRGLKMIVSGFGGGSSSEFHNPVSSKHHMVESLTVFDDVFVPWERVFMKGERRYAGPLAVAFVDFHRYTAISYKAPLLDLLVGLAELVAEYNGIKGAGHVREKLTQLIAYSQTVQGLTLASAVECRIEDGVAIPNPTLTNVAKYHFASNYHRHVSYLQDIAGGLVATGPSEEDLKSPVTRGYVEKFLAGAKGSKAEERLRVINLVRDLTASDFGGYNEILQIHAEGSIEAEKLMIHRSYDNKSNVEYARRLANISFEE